MPQMAMISFFVSQPRLSTLLITSCEGRVARYEVILALSDAALLVSYRRTELAGPIMLRSTDES